MAGKSTKSRKSAKSASAHSASAHNVGANTDGETIIIKKYANRRLYDTRASQYVTLDNLAAMVRNDEDFVVVDAKTGENLTRSVLAQIIFEAEAKGANMLPTNFLRQIIGFYGDSLQSMLPDYLEHTMTAFSTHQNELRGQLSQMGTAFGLPQYEEIGRRNVAMFERATEMFSPFGAGFGAGEPQQSKDEAPVEASEGEGAGADNKKLDTLKAQLDALQRQLNELDGFSNK